MGNHVTFFLRYYVVQSLTSKEAEIIQEKLRHVDVILMQFCAFSGQPCHPVIVLDRGGRYVADACHADNYSRSAL